MDSKFLAWAQKEVADFEIEETTKCDSCGMTDFKENMWALGYGNKFLCDLCWDEAEEEENE